MKQLWKLLLFPLALQAQVPLDSIVEDTSNMGDTHEATFTYQGQPYSGAATRYHANGQLHILRNFKEGKAVGEWKVLDPEGNTIDTGDDTHKYFTPFFATNIAPEGFEETSPSLTADGKTMVFARHTDWVHKVPFIAHLREGQWHKTQLQFVDTIYNLAISPQGHRIVYSTFEEQGDKEIRKAFFVDKVKDLWSTPREITSLANISAGYFQIMASGRLYFFARQPKIGIYFADPIGDKGYGTPVWLSDAVGLPNSDSFDAFLNPEENKLVVSQAYSQKKFPDRGEIGMYYYEKVGEQWKRIKRLPLGYGWGALITPDRKFVFVRNEDIQYIPLDALNIPW